MSITRQVGAKIADYADEIKKFFIEEVHVTVVVRNPKGDDRSMVITADDTNQILAFLQRFHHDTEKPKPVRTIEESLEQLEGKNFGVVRTHRGWSIAYIYGDSASISAGSSITEALSELVNKIKRAEE